MELVWEIMSNHLYSSHQRFNLKIHSFVLMTNHFHLLASTPEGNLSECMAYFMKATSSDLTLAGNRINQTYGGRYFRSVIENDHHYLHAYKYIYRNPVKAGLCKNVEDYRYSTLHGLLGKSHLPIPVLDDKRLFEDVDRNLIWLNESPSEEDWKTVSTALKKSKFKIKKGSKFGTPHRLEYNLL